MRNVQYLTVRVSVSHFLQGSVLPRLARWSVQIVHMYSRTSSAHVNASTSFLLYKDTVAVHTSRAIQWPRERRVQIGCITEMFVLQSSPILMKGCGCQESSPDDGTLMGRDDVSVPSHSVVFWRNGSTPVPFRPVPSREITGPSLVPREVTGLLH